jgi:hypothetical protein
VDIVLKGLVSKRFLNPVAHTERIKVSCEPPISQKLHWAQASSNKAILPKNRVDENGQRTHFVMTNSNHTMRLIMLDKSGFASLNHMFINSEVKLSEPLATLDHLDYDKRVLKVGEKPGTLYVSSKAKAYLKDRKSVDIKNDVSDKMKIEIVESVKVEPQFKSMYFNADKN